MFKKIVSYIIVLFLLGSAIAHIVLPEFYAPMIPDFISVSFANILSAVVEVVVAVLLFLPKYRKWGGLGFMALMIGFLPVHVCDLFKDNPTIGEPPVPIIRVIVQFVLIYSGWWIYRQPKK